VFKLFHNEREISEITSELGHKNQLLEKEAKKQQRIDDELRDKKRDHGKLVRDVTKLEQQIKDSVIHLFANIALFNILHIAHVRSWNSVHQYILNISTSLLYVSERLLSFC